MASETPLERFREMFEGGIVRLDVAAACIAAHVRPRDTAVDAILGSLDELASLVEPPTLDGLIAALFRDEAFVGNQDAYYDPANSYLDQVIERRTGIPITLAVLMIEVGRRVGVPLFGVGMPGHFLVGDRVDQELYIDPFRSGVRLDARQAQAIFETMHPEGARWDPALLAETPPADIVLRMLNNLRMIHLQTQSVPELIAVLELMVLLPGCPPSEFRALAEALARMGRIDDAVGHLERLAERVEGDEQAAVRSAITRMWGRLN